ncbi:hypothetical protein QYM36_015842, partial [Artemia franciscana]
TNKAMGKSGNFTPNDKIQEKVNYGEPDEMDIDGFQVNKLKRILTIVATILTFGGLSFILTWKKKIKLKLTCDNCNISQASRVLLKDEYGQMFEEVVVQEEGQKYFYNKQVKYLWSDQELRFFKMRPYDEGKSCFSLWSEVGLNSEEVSKRRDLYGTNEIKVHITPISTLVLKEAINPFYIFQIYAIVLWIIQAYYYYSAVVATMSIISIGVTVWETRKQCKYLRQQVAVTGTAKVLRDKKVLTVPIDALVPGDVIVLTEENKTIPCDLALLTGTCSVNESLLTGESIPVAKVPIPKEHHLFDQKYHGRHILLGGTEFLQGRNTDDSSVKAVVIRTGFQSVKGELIRSILFPKPVNIHFYTDFLRCVGIFLILGIGGFVYSTYVWIKNGGSVADIVLNSLDSITFVIPPILPAALTASMAFAQKRLKKNDIYCLNSKFISMCGGVNVVCFDKTGTLTESEIVIAGVLPVVDGCSCSPISDLNKMARNSDIITAMAVCHCVVKSNGVLQGNAADITLFEASKWELLPPVSSDESTFGFKPQTIVTPPSEETERIAILKQFPFESFLQRTAVVFKRKGAKNLSVMVKGAPEKIYELCDSLFIPRSFDDTLKFYTNQGYRVLALAGGDLKEDLTPDDVMHNIKREDLETNLELYGLVITQNQTKESTYEAISELDEADIRSLMVTGDNLQTALFVAKDVGIVHENEQIIQVTVYEIPASVNAARHLRISYIDPFEDIELLGKRDPLSFKPVHGSNYVFCIEGPSFELLYQQNVQLLRKILVRGRVFARMLPDQKVKLIESLQELSYQVMMCGDGCNDCGALKMAHAGVSLSMADASIAAPFTSRKQNISCVPYLIKEGRVSVTAGFCSFQFGTAISFSLFAAVLIMYSVSTEPSDLQYMYLSEGHVIVPFLCLGNVAPWPVLVKRRPPKRILAPLPIMTIVTFLIWQIIIYAIGWTFCQNQPWFEPFEYVPNLHPPNPSYDQTVQWQLFLMTCIAAAVTISPGPPYSKHVFTNKIFAVWFLLAVSLTTSGFFCRNTQFVYDLNLRPAPYVEFAAVLYMLGFCGILFCYLWERFFFREVIYNYIMPRLEALKGPREAYEFVEAEIKANPSWPPMSRHKEASAQIGLPVIDETEEFDSLSEVSTRSGAFQIPPLLATDENNASQEASAYEEGLTFTREKLSFRTFGRSKKPKSIKKSLREEIPFRVEDNSNEQSTAITVINYTKLNVSDLPDAENVERSEPIEETTNNIDLVNYRELSSSTPFLPVNGH